MGVAKENASRERFFNDPIRFVTYPKAIAYNESKLFCPKLFCQNTLIGESMKNNSSILYGFLWVLHVIFLQSYAHAQEPTRTWKDAAGMRRSSVCSRPFDSSRLPMVLAKSSEQVPNRKHD